MSGSPSQNDRKALHEEVATSIAQQQVNNKQAERAANRGEESPGHKQPVSKRPDLDSANAQPPRIIKGVVLFQAQVKMKRFLRQFGPNGLTEQPDLAPPSPQVTLALYMCRRLTKPHWVNAKKIALESSTSC